MLTNKQEFLMMNRSLVDVRAYRASRNDYIKYLNTIGRIFKGVDFTSNLLIVGNRNVSKSVFLYGMSNMDFYTSYMHFNINDLIRINFLDKLGSDLEDDECVKSLNDINTDIFMVTISGREMEHKYKEKLLIETIFHRIDGAMSADLKKMPKLNWIFYTGTVDKLKADKEYRELFSLFDGNKEIDFKLYDMSELYRNYKSTKMEDNNDEYNNQNLF